MHKVPEALSSARVIDPDQVCDAVAVLADSDRLSGAAETLDVLGEVNRLSILLALQHAGDLCVSDLAVAVRMSDSAVSHALRLLRAHHMVTAHRQGRLVRYRIADGLARRLLEVVSAEAVRHGPLHAHGHSDTGDAGDAGDAGDTGDTGDTGDAGGPDGGTDGSADVGADGGRDGAA